MKWKDDISAPVIGGVTPTAGGVTFAGDIKGNFFAEPRALIDYLASLPGS